MAFRLLFIIGFIRGKCRSTANTCDDVVISCRTQVVMMCVEFFLLLVRCAVQDPYSGRECYTATATKLPTGSCRGSSKKKSVQSMAFSYPALSEARVFLQLFLSMLGQIKMGRFPELIDDLIKPVKYTFI